MAEEADVSGAALQLLLENHRAFLRFLERKVGDRAAAEDILQEAFTRNLDRLESVGEEAILPWFYRTLRNAAIDYHRRRGAAGRAMDAFAKQLGSEEAPSPEMAAEICACVSRLAGTLKPEYAAVLHSVDVDGVPVKEFAARNQLSPNNAGVRVFRAREALRKRVVQSCGTCAEHGCLDCTCQR
jgi:RNA polymerase sigma-70 factor (ECF subfamily)